MTNILITGGTGLVGRHLCKRLQEKGYAIAILSRANKKGTIPSYFWDLKTDEIEKEAIEFADCIIHLAGENIADKRWTVKRRQLIIDSRVNSGQLIFNKIKEQNKNLNVFISASAIGFYGAISSDKIFKETDFPADDFMGNTCRQWEQMTDMFKDLGIRTVKIRTGAVLTRQGGILSKMKIAVNMGVGSALGPGNQYLPWIHIDDLCGIYIKAIEDIQMEGPYNAVAPDHVTNKAFIRTFARVLKKPFWLPNVPAYTLKMVFGKMSKIFLQGSRVSADKIKQAGYIFLFPNLEDALNQLLKKD